MPSIGLPDPLPSLPARFRLTPEFRLLLASTWVAPAASAQSQAGAIAAASNPAVDWNVFLALLDRHRVLAPPDLLGRVLGPRLPDPVREQLASRKAEACRQALRQGAELIRLHNAFGAQGIEMIPIKGVMLSMQLYGDPAVRSSRDLDILVKPERLVDAGEVLEAEGYRCTDPDFELTPRRRRWILEHGPHFTYCHDGRRQLVELHWRFPLWRRRHVAELWNCCATKAWMDTDFLTFSDEILLLFLCDHGAKHQWRRIKWLADVAALLGRASGISWETVLALAGRLDLCRPLAQAGTLASWLYAIPLPEPLVGLIERQKSAGALAAAAVEAMRLDEDEQFALPERLKAGVAPRHLRERLPRLETLRAALLSTDEFKEFPLPDRWFWLYFPLRPLLWFYHHYLRSGK
jgi:hypothetical protein